VARERDKLPRLRELAVAPEERQAYAMQLLRTERAFDVVLGALGALDGTTDPAARPLLVATYARLEGGGGQRDRGAYARMAVMQALRRVATREDVPLIERALLTYEWLPPGPSEVGEGLRASALVVLHAVDDRLASYHAARLLHDPHASPMSGEPAVSAVRMLAALGQHLPLYAYLIHDHTALPEVQAECLWALTELPPALLPALVERYGDHPHDIVVIGLLDLLLARPDDEGWGDYIANFLRATKRYDIFRYLASRIVAARRTELVEELRALASRERDHLRASILREALALLK
jgi:hypothetical protein